MNASGEMKAESFNVQSYEKLNLDELLTYCIFRLTSENKEATFERIVAKSFELFPGKFSLSGYPMWPDSARVNKSWLRCRTDFKYIHGSVKNGFRLTEKGLEVVKKVQFHLDRPINERQLVDAASKKGRTREEAFLKEIMKSDVYQRYLKEGENASVTHFEFCDSLFCTLETPPKTLKENLAKLKEYSSRMNRNDVYDFLSFLETKFKRMLMNKEGNPEFAMGMNKKKLGGK